MAKIEFDITPLTLQTTISIDMPNKPLLGKPYETDLSSLPRNTVEQLCDQFKSRMLTWYDQQVKSTNDRAMDDRNAGERWSR
jgi:hypothetical protein